MEAARTFALIDQDLIGFTGHNLTYARRVLTAAGQAGFRTVAGVRQDATGAELPAETHPIFVSDLRANNPGYARRWHTAALLRRRLDIVGAQKRASPAAMTAAGQPFFRRLQRLLAGVTEDVGVVVCAGRPSRIFASQLAAFLEVAALAPGDIVFMPTVLAGEVRAVERLIQASPLARRLRWRLLMRYAPGERLVRRSLAEALRRLRKQARVDILIYADTEELRAFYEAFCPTGFGLLPIPVADTAPASRDRSTALVIGCFGDFRSEKGADLLPDIIRRALALCPVDLLFLVQTNFNIAEGDTSSHAALEALAVMEGRQLELVEGPLSPADYEMTFRRAHVVLLPYQPQAYAQRSSGILMEALAAGLPTVVTTGSWMQRVLEQAPPHAPAGRIAPPDSARLAEALSEVATDWERFAEGARSLGRSLRWRSDPDCLIRRLDDNEDERPDTSH